MTFRQYAQQAAEQKLAAIPEALRPEIYVLAFNIWRVDHDARHPYVDIGWNTETQFRKELAQQQDPDPVETRWNYAFWILEGFEKLGNVPEDPDGSVVYLEEVRKLGLWYDDGTAADLSEDEQDARDDLLGVHFSDVCVQLARDLHASGRIAELFGRSLPVVIFDMDCPGWEAEATQAANPPELVADFLAFVGPTA